MTRFLVGLAATFLLGQPGAAAAGPVSEQAAKFAALAQKVDALAGTVEQQASTIALLLLQRQLPKKLLPFVR